VKPQTPSAVADLMASVDHLPPVPLQRVSRPKPAVQRGEVQQSAEEIAEQEEAEPEAVHRQGNRIVHGVKKMNPKHLWARITGK